MLINGLYEQVINKEIEEKRKSLTDKIFQTAPIDKAEGSSDASPTGQRYINHELLGSNVVLFVRERKKVDGLTEPCYCLGTAKFVSCEGSKPMSIVWKLDNKMPEFIKKKASGNVMVG